MKIKLQQYDHIPVIINSTEASNLVSKRKWTSTPNISPRSRIILESMNEHTEPPIVTLIHTRSIMTHYAIPIHKVPECIAQCQSGSFVR